MASKITQIYTLIDEASATLDEIALGYKKVDAAIDKNAETNKRATGAEKQANVEHRKTVETLTAVKQARTIEDKQIKSAERAYKRLIARYDATERVTQRVAAATKILDNAQKRGLLSQTQYKEQLRRVTRGIEDQTLATQRNAMAQLSLSKIWERAKFILKTFIAAMAIRAIYAFTVGIVDARLAVDKMNATLRASTGSLAQSKIGLEFVKKTANDLGLVYKDLAIQYSKFVASTQNTSLESQTDQVFTGFSKAAVALRLSASETEGIFRALVQMVSKGTVQAEELRGQLGERLPGALRIAADSLGVTTQRLGKMLEQGQVIAEDLLPEMSKRLEDIYGLEAQRAAESMVSRISAMKNAWFDLLSALGKGAAGGFMTSMFEAAEFLLNTIRSTIEDGSASIDKFQRNILGTVRAFENLEDRKLGFIVAELGNVDTALRKLQRQMDTTGELDEVQKGRVRDLMLQYSAYRVVLQEVANELGGLNEKTEDMNLATEKAGNALQGLVEEYDPLFKATQKYEQDLAVLNNAVLLLDISEERQIELLALIDKAYGKTAASALGTAKTTATASKLRRRALADERRELKLYEKAWDAIIKQSEAQEKSDLSLKTQLKLNQAWKGGARDLTDLTNSMALLEVQRAAEVRARKNGLAPGQEEFDTFVASEVGGERVKQENKLLSEQRASLDGLALGAEAYANGIEDIYRLHEKESPGAVEAIKRLNIEYAYLLDTTDQLKLGMSEAFISIRDSSSDIFTEVKQVISDTFKGAEDAVIQFAQTGKLEVKGMIDSILEDILRLTIQKAITAPIAGALAGAFTGSTGLTTAATASAGTGHGTSSMFGNSTIQMRQGGSFRVPGTGVTDSRLVAFRAAPGERVTVDPVGSEGARAGGPRGGGSGGNVNVIINNSASDTETRTESRTGPGGMRELVVFVENIVAKSVSSNGTVGRAMDSTRGTKQRGVVR